MNYTDQSAQAAKDFRATFEGKLAPEVIKCMVAHITASNTGATYVATATYNNEFVVYQTWSVAVPLGKTFNGKSGGVGGVGTANSLGVVKTASESDLFDSTKSFSFTVAQGYTLLGFFDGSHKPIGSFLGAPIDEKYWGLGGGTGTWG